MKAISAGGAFGVALTTSGTMFPGASTTSASWALVGIGDVVAVGAGNSSFSGFAIMR